LKVGRFKGRNVEMQRRTGIKCVEVEGVGAIRVEVAGGEQNMRNGSRWSTEA
jgi:hypothetical protein